MTGAACTSSSADQSESSASSSVLCSSCMASRAAYAHAPMVSEQAGIAASKTRLAERLAQRR